MPTTPGKRTARLRTTLTKRVIDTLQPTDKPWIAWDDKLSGFGVCIRPSGTKSFIVNYRIGDRGRMAPNKRVVIARARSPRIRSGAPARRCDRPGAGRRPMKGRNPGAPR